MYKKVSTTFKDFFFNFEAKTKLSLLGRMGDVVGRITALPGMAMS